MQSDAISNVREQASINNPAASGPIITPYDAALGAEVTGIDMSKAISEADMSKIRDALLRYSVLVLRGQNLQPDHELAFMDRLYPLREKRKISLKAMASHPQLSLVSNIVEDGRAIGLIDAGMLWHSDTCFMPNPELFVSLYALEVPYRDGVALGDTLWVSTAAAYDALPDSTKRRLAGKKVLQSYPWHEDKMRRLGLLKRPPVPEAALAEIVPTWQPAVRTHPITGRKVLYTSESFSAQLDGMTEAESTALLEELWAHIQQPRFMFRHNWKVGDFVVWDNCATQHHATFDYGDIRRLLHRCGTDGPLPQ